jgi:hypothetical protein
MIALKEKQLILKFLSRIYSKKVRSLSIWYTCFLPHVQKKFADEMGCTARCRDDQGHRCCEAHGARIALIDRNVAGNSTKILEQNGLH